MCWIPRHILSKSKTYFELLNFLSILILLIGSSLLVSKQIKSSEFGAFLVTYSSIELFRLLCKWCLIFWNSETTTAEPRIKISRFKLNPVTAGEKSPNIKRLSNGDITINRNYSLPVGLADAMLKQRNKNSEINIIIDPVSKSYSNSNDNITDSQFTNNFLDIPLTDGYISVEEIDFDDSL